MTERGARRRTRTQAALPLWAWPTALSLDAPTVAVVWQLLFARSFGLEPSWVYPLLLWLSVWLIYAGDRLLDSLSLELGRRHTYRHALYARYRAQLTTLWLVVLGVTAVLATTRLALTEQLAGAALLGAVGLYGLGVHVLKRLSLSKEALVGLVFATGVTLPLWTSGVGAALLLPALLVALLCSLNCALIAVWERDIDRIQGQPSLALALSPLPNVITPLLLGYSLLTFSTRLVAPPELVSAAGMSGLLLAGLSPFRRPSEALRVLADVALLTPLVYLFLT